MVSKEALKIMVEVLPTSVEYSIQFNFCLKKTYFHTITGQEIVGKKSAKDQRIIV